MRSRHPLGTVVSDGEQREYFVRLPANFDPTKQYWLLAAIHGGGGNGRQWNLGRYWSIMQEMGLNAILVIPSLGTSARPDEFAFPSLGEGNVFIAMIEKLQATYWLRPKILLTGFSGGGNFVHRFTYQHPERVFATAAHSAGSWTTPDGRFLVKGLGEVIDAQTLAGGERIPESSRQGREHYLNDRAVSAGTRTVPPNAARVPFLVMCGTLDTERLDNAKEFARSLAAFGFPVETGWPQAPHDLTDDFLRRTVQFFVDLD